MPPVPDDDEAGDEGEEGGFTPEGEDPGDDHGGGWSGDFGDGDGSVRKYYVDDVEVRILNERVMYYGKDGKLITESLKDYTKKTVRSEYATLDDFIKKWNNEERKQVILEELTEHGVFLEALKEEVGKDYDEFDLILHIAYDQKPLTRSERAKKARKEDYLSKYQGVAREVIEGILDKYQDEGRFDFDDVKLLELNPFNELGNPMKIAKSFGGKSQYRKALKELENNLYA